MDPHLLDRHGIQGERKNIIAKGPSERIELGITETLKLSNTPEGGFPGERGGKTANSSKKGVASAIAGKRKPMLASATVLAKKGRLCRTKGASEKHPSVGRGSPVAAKRFVFYPKNRTGR